MVSRSFPLHRCEINCYQLYLCLTTIHLHQFKNWRVKLKINSTLTIHNFMSNLKPAGLPNWESLLVEEPNGHSTFD